MAIYPPQAWTETIASSSTHEEYAPEEGNSSQWDRDEDAAKTATAFSELLNPFRLYSKAGAPWAVSDESKGHA